MTFHKIFGRTKIGTENDINIFGMPFDLNVEPGSNGIDIGQYSTDESVNMISIEIINNLIPLKHVACCVSKYFISSSYSG